MLIFKRLGIAMIFVLAPFLAHSSDSDDEDATTHPTTKAVQSPPHSLKRERNPVDSSSSGPSSGTPEYDVLKEILSTVSDDSDKEEPSHKHKKPAEDSDDEDAGDDAPVVVAPPPPATYNPSNTVFLCPEISFSPTNTRSRCNCFHHQQISFPYGWLQYLNISKTFGDGSWETSANACITAYFNLPQETYTASFPRSVLPTSDLTEISALISNPAWRDFRVEVSLEEGILFNYSWLPFLSMGETEWVSASSSAFIGAIFNLPNTVHVAYFGGDLESLSEIVPTRFSISNPDRWQVLFG